MLIPENTMKKQADFLVACFFLASLLFFFSSGKINFASGADFDLVEIEYVNFEQEYSNLKRQEIASQMKQRLNAVLAEQNIYPQEIFTIVNISDGYSISINEIRLVFLKSEADESDEELENLKKAIHIVQKEVNFSDRILITGEFKT